jgi:hypothetical protein
MAHRQKVERLIEELSQQGMGYYTVAPPLFWLLWALGLEVPPPLFLGFRKLTLLMGTFFGVLWGALWGVGMWLWAWQGMARRNPSGYCGHGNGVRGGARRVSLWASHGLVHTRESSAAGYTIVVGGVSQGLKRLDHIKANGPESESSALSIPGVSEETGLGGQLVRREPLLLLPLLCFLWSGLQRCNAGSLLSPKSPILNNSLC